VFFADNTAFLLARYAFAVWIIAPFFLLRSARRILLTSSFVILCPWDNSEMICCLKPSRISSTISVGDEDTAGMAVGKEGIEIRVVGSDGSDGSDGNDRTGKPVLVLIGSPEIGSIGNPVRVSI
jgi:hypothetical protein